MLLGRLIAVRRRRRVSPDWDVDDFWVRTLSELCRTLNSIREHGGFAELSGRWSADRQTECVEQLDTLIDTLNDWRQDLRAQVQQNEQRQMGKEHLREEVSA